MSDILSETENPALKNAAIYLICSNTRLFIKNRLMFTTYESGLQLYELNSCSGWVFSFGSCLQVASFGSPSIAIVAI